MMSVRFMARGVVVWAIPEVGTVCGWQAIPH
jgi:hypothetical protein